MVFYQDPHGSPVRLWLHDDDGCPLSARHEEVRSAPSVLLREEDLLEDIGRVYPLRTVGQVVLYEALELPMRDHETALALLAPFLELDDDVLVLAAELYSVTNSSASNPGRDVLDVAGLLFDVVASARSLVH